MHKHPPLPETFAKLGIATPFLKALGKMNFVHPSDIQQALIPPALSGRDVLGQAKTGTGKTAAFSLPMLQQIDASGRLQGICLAPTRELAVQVAAEMTRIAEFANLHIVAVYGGQKVATQLHQLGRKPHVVVGTPGRVIDFIKRGVLQLDSVRFVVLDEVDRMLDIGFRDDIRWILGKVPQPHQTTLVSATLDGEIKRLASQYMTNPVEVNVSRDVLTVDQVDQWYVTVEESEKFGVLMSLLEQYHSPITIVFCNMKHTARKLAKKLHAEGVNAQEIHGDLLQAKRDRVMDGFRKHRIKVLVATDLAARGIDVSAVTHIVNYDVPQDSQVYVHRIGRTARMGAKGVAVTFATRNQGKELTAIEMLINREIPQRNVTGFASRSESDKEAFEDMAQAPEHAAPRAVKPAAAPPVAAATTAVAPALPPKTLGARFKPSRRRR